MIRSQALQTDFTETDFLGSDLSKTIFVDSIFYRTYLEETDLSKARLVNIDLSQTRVKHSNPFEGIELKEIYLASQGEIDVRS